MDFEVEIAKGWSVPYSGKSTYEVGEYGVLTVTTDDGRRITYAPSAWVHVEEHPVNRNPSDVR